MLNSQINKIQAITSDTLIVGVDIAKNIQWAQFINFRGIEVSRLLNICKNRIHACVDEYFPEFETVFKSFIKGKVALHI